MEAYSVSFTLGRGSLAHNLRTGSGKRDHVDPEKTRTNNITFVNEPLRDAYLHVFGEAQKKYALKRGCEEPDYYAKIRKSRGASKMHGEIIIQFGDQEHCPPLEQCQKMQQRFFELFRERHPNFYIFCATFHGDEPGAPHTHIDFIPFADGYTHGLERQYSLHRALQMAGYSSSNADFTRWVRDMKDLMAEVLKEYGCEREEVGNRDRHLNIHDYKEAMNLADIEAERIVTQARKEAELMLENARESAGLLRKRLPVERLEQARKTAGQLHEILSEPLARLVQAIRPLNRRRKLFSRALQLLDEGMRSDGSLYLDPQKQKAFRDELRKIEGQVNEQDGELTRVREYTDEILLQAARTSDELEEDVEKILSTLEKDYVE